MSLRVKIETMGPLLLCEDWEISDYYSVLMSPL